MTYLDFNMYSATCPIFKQDTIPVYDPEEDADIIAYMEENGIEAPMAWYHGYYPNSLHSIVYFLSGHLGIGGWNVNDGRH